MKKIIAALMLFAVLTVSLGVTAANAIVPTNSSSCPVQTNTLCVDPTTSAGPQIIWYAYDAPGFAPTKHSFNITLSPIMNGNAAALQYGVFGTMLFSSFITSTSGEVAVGTGVISGLPSIDVYNRYDVNSYALVFEVLMDGSVSQCGPGARDVYCILPGQNVVNSKGETVTPADTLSYLATQPGFKFRKVK